LIAAKRRKRRKGARTFLSAAMSLLHPAGDYVCRCLSVAVADFSVRFFCQRMPRITIPTAANAANAASIAPMTRKGIYGHPGNAIPPTPGLYRGGLCPPDPSSRSLAVFLGGLGGPPLHFG
jgi:hypothetical protein